MRDSHHSMGLMSHAALVQGLATREAFDEAFREHALSKPEPGLPTTPGRDLPTPSIIAEEEASEHAEIRRGSSFTGVQQPTAGPHVPRSSVAANS